MSATEAIWGKFFAELHASADRLRQMMENTVAVSTTLAGENAATADTTPTEAGERGHLTMSSPLGQD